MNLFIYKNGQQLGSFSEEQVRSMIVSGMLSREDLSWKEGWEDWKPLVFLFPEESKPQTTPPPLPSAVQVASSSEKSVSSYDCKIKILNVLPVNKISQVEKMY